MPDSNTTATVVAAAICISGPLFFSTSIALFVLWLVQMRKARTFQRSSTEKITALENATIQLKQNALQALRNEWFQNVTRTNYRNEVEVEVKFVHPLLQFLQYDSNDCQLRVPVTIQVGRQVNKGEADWVLWGNTQGQRQAMVVIEAKSPDKPLDTTVQRQAQSYAFALNAPMYVLTNGREIKIFRRGVQGDTCVVDCSVNNLYNWWTEIEQAIGARLSIETTLYNPQHRCHPEPLVEIS